MAHEHPSDMRPDREVREVRARLPPHVMPHHTEAVSQMYLDTTVIL